MSYIELPRQHHPDFIGLNEKPVFDFVLDEDHKLFPHIEEVFAPVVGNRLTGLKNKYVNPITSTAVNNGKSVSYPGYTEYDNRPAAAGNRTLLVRLRANASGSNEMAVLSVRVGSGAYNQYTLLINGWLNHVGAVAKVPGIVSAFALGNTSQHTYAYTTATNLIDGKWHNIAIVLRDGEHPSIFHDGNKQAVTVGSYTYIPSKAWANNQHTGIGAAVDAGSSPLTGDVELAAFFNTAASDDQAKELTKDIYQILKPASPMQLFMGAAGPGPASANDEYYKTLLSGSLL